MRKLWRLWKEALSFTLAHFYTKIMPHRTGVAVFCIVLVGILALTEPSLAQDVTKPNGPGLLDNMLLLMAGLVLSVAQVLGQIVVLLLDVIIIPIMQYNGFSTSNVVAAGWAITRDVVNMFFVVILIAIAIGTIFGIDRFQWQKQTARLLLFAILINFSKTLAGIMIDFGQVVMLTFVNALKDIAGGNFVQLLGLGEILSVSKSNDVRSLVTGTNAVGFQAFDWAAAAIAALMMMIIVLATVLILAVILAYRIVILWILIVMAPLAWFVGGAKDVINKSDAYAQWWKQFTCAILIGPVITFFLWLTLAVAGAGNIAASEGFQTAEVAQEVGIASSPSGNIIQIFEVSRMTSFIIGIAMIFAGFQAANTLCQGSPLSGLVGKTNPGGILKSARRQTGRLARGIGRTGNRAVRTGSTQASKFGKGAASLGLQSVKYGAGVGAKYVAPEAQALLERSKYSPVRSLSRVTALGGARGRSKELKKLHQKALDSGFPLSDTAAAFIGRKKGDQDKVAATEIAEPGKKYEGLSSVDKLSHLKAAAKNGIPKTERGRRALQDLFVKETGSPKARKALGSDFDTLYKAFGEQSKETPVTIEEIDENGEKIKRVRNQKTVLRPGLEDAFANDPEMKKRVKELKRARPDLIDGLKGSTPEQKAELFKKHGFNSAEDFRGIDAVAFESADVTELAKGINTGRRDRNGNDISVRSHALRGGFGADAAEAVGKRVNVSSLLDSAVYDNAKGEFKDSSDRGDFEYLVGKNPVELLSGTSDESSRILSEINNNGGDNEVADSIAQGITAKDESNLLRQYDREKDPEKLKELEATLGALESALDGQAKFSSDDKVQKRAQKFKEKKKLIGNKRANVGIDSANLSLNERVASVKDKIRNLDSLIQRRVKEKNQQQKVERGGLDQKLRDEEVARDGFAGGGEQFAAQQEAAKRNIIKIKERLQKLDVSLEATGADFKKQRDDLNKEVEDLEGERQNREE